MPATRLIAAVLMALLITGTALTGTAVARTPRHAPDNPAGPPGPRPGPPPVYPDFNRAYEWPLAQMRAPSLWKITRGAGVTVAVLDTGVNERQPDLVSAFVYEDDLLSASNGGADLSKTSHGTAVAGIIAGRGSAGGQRQMIGLAPLASLFDIRISAQTGPVPPAVAAEGIVVAARNGARIINISLPVRTASPELAHAVAYATRRGCLIIAGAGARGQPQALARYPHVLIVAASGKNGEPTPSRPATGRVSLLAPGVDIYSTGEPSGQGSSHGGYVYGLDGSGYAAAYVSAAAALLISAKPSVTVGEVRNYLQQGVHPVGGQTEFGLLDPKTALRLEFRPPGPAPGISVTDVLTLVAAVLAMTLAWSGFHIWRYQRPAALVAAAYRHSRVSWSRW